MKYREMRKLISCKQLPISVIDVDKITKVLADFDRRINKLENFLGFTITLNEHKSTKKKTKKKKD